MHQEYYVMSEYPLLWDERIPTKLKANFFRMVIRPVMIDESDCCAF